MCAQVEEQHAEEEERFRKLQIQDTSMLNDRLDQLIVINLSIILVFFFQKKILFQDECCWISRS